MRIFRQLGILVFAFMQICAFGQNADSQDSISVYGDSNLNRFCVEYYIDGCIVSAKEFVNNNLAMHTYMPTSDTLKIEYYYDSGLISMLEIFVLHDKNAFIKRRICENLYEYYLYKRIEYNRKGKIMRSEEYSFFFSSEKNRYISLLVFLKINETNGKPRETHTIEYDKDLNVIN